MTSNIFKCPNCSGPVTPSEKKTLQCDYCKFHFKNPLYSKLFSDNEGAPASSSSGTKFAIAVVLAIFISGAVIYLMNKDAPKPALSSLTASPHTDTPAQRVQPINQPLPAEANPNIKKNSELTVIGSLPKQVVQKTIRGHINEVNTCYERALSKTPKLTGRVLINMVINDKGTIYVASLFSSELDNPIVEKCIVTAVKSWTFPPPPGGGMVIVKYPFIFKN